MSHLLHYFRLIQNFHSVYFSRRLHANLAISRLLDFPNLQNSSKGSLSNGLQQIKIINCQLFIFLQRLSRHDFLLPLFLLFFNYRQLRMKKSIAVEPA